MRQPAFPIAHPGFLYPDGSFDPPEAQEGMSLRDYFAAQALTAACAGRGLINPEFFPKLAERCYQVADAMMDQRDKS